MLDECAALPGITVGRNCWIRKAAVMDAGCRIADGVVIGKDPVEDKRRFHVTRGGVVLITPEMLGQTTPE